MATEVQELESGAANMRLAVERAETVQVAALGVAIADLLDYAAERLTAHPGAIGPMTQHSVRIAMLINEYAAEAALI